MHRRRDQGQSVTETILLLPFFLALAFFGLQASQLGMGLVLANYGASKIAHQAVAQDTTDVGQFQAYLDRVLVGSMRTESVTGTVDRTDVVATLKVDAKVGIPAFPFVGALLSGKVATDPSGIFYLSSSVPYTWTVNGAAQARMNYRP